MILNGNQRGNSKELALHLLKEENELVEVHEIRGFVSSHLAGAFQESYAISRATQCKQHLYSLSLNPPKDTAPTNEDFKAAIARVEKQLGLAGQPCVIVFHEKRGMDGELRRHCHAVWCRIDIEKMKAIPLPFTKMKLREVSRELFIQHNWRMPDGLLNRENRNPRNFTLAEWQQAKRAGKDAKQLKSLFMDCWTLSDSKSALKSALLEQGFVLAQGKRGHVAVDYQGEVYPLSRWTGQKAKDIRARLGEPENLPDVERAHAIAAKIVTGRLEVLKQQEKQSARDKILAAREKSIRLKSMQHRTVKRIQANRQQRRDVQKAEHNTRIRKGVRGLIDRMTGRRKCALLLNIEEMEALKAGQLQESQVLQDQHRQNLETLKNQAKSATIPHKANIKELDQDIAWLSSPPELSGRTIEEEQEETRKRRNNRSRDGPILGR